MVLTAQRVYSAVTPTYKSISRRVSGPRKTSAFFPLWLTYRNREFRF